MSHEPVDVKSFRAKDSIVKTPEGVKKTRIGATLKRIEKFNIVDDIQVYNGKFGYEIELVFHPNVLPIKKEPEHCGNVLITESDRKVVGHYSIFDDSLDNVEHATIDFENFFKIVETSLCDVYPDWFLDVKIDRKKVIDKREILKEWTIRTVAAKTNLSKPQLVDLNCKLEKLHNDDPKDFTWVERKLLGYTNDKYIIDVTPSDPIRENRDKDYLPGFSEEGNDAIHAFSFAVAWVRDENPDLSDENLHKKVMEHIVGFNEEEKRHRAKEREKEKNPWYRRTYLSKRFGDYSNGIKLGIFSQIYPFHGDDLSGCTDWLSIEFHNDDEDGLGVDITIAGFHFYIYSCTLQRFMQKMFCKNKPKRDSTMDWNEYYLHLKKWQKNYKREYFWDADWIYELSFSRNYGLKLSREFDNSCGGKWGFRLNPFRNKFWNFI